MTQEERELFDLAVSLLEESLPIVIAHGANDFRVRVHKGAIAEIKELLEREDEDEDEGDPVIIGTLYRFGSEVGWDWNPEYQSSVEEAQRIDDASWRP